MSSVIVEMTLSHVYPRLSRCKDDLRATRHALLRFIMSNCTWCPSCCSRCFTLHLQAPTSDSPFSLRNLLLGGTLTLKKPRIGVIHQKNCVHGHEEDGWHIFRSDWLIEYLESSELALIQDIDFLIRHNFVRATCRGAQDGRLVLRIYLVQFDLSNVQGRLRIRKENILSAARRYMRALLPKLSQSPDKWLGREILPGKEDRYLINETIVSFLFISSAQSLLSF